MALPDKPLELDLQEMELGDWEWYGETLDGFSYEHIGGFVQFLIHASNWTAEEIRCVKGSEIQALMEMVGAQLAAEQDEAVPPPTSGGLNEAECLGGETSLQSPSNGESRPGSSPNSTRKTGASGIGGKRRGTKRGPKRSK